MPKQRELSKFCTFLVIIAGLKLTGEKVKSESTPVGYGSSLHTKRFHFRDWQPDLLLRQNTPVVNIIKEGDFRTNKWTQICGTVSAYLWNVRTNGIP